MSQFTTEQRTVRRRRRALLAGLTAFLGIGALVGIAVLLSLGAGESTDGPGVWRSEGKVHIEPNSLDVIYRGQRISSESLQSLNDQGKGMFTATDVDTASDLHATRAFDAQAELDVYTDAYMAWLRSKREHDDVRPWGIVAPQGWSPTKE